ncbi:MAG: hypothetical protein E2O76_14675 [Caldithrix sp.]|nr:MAG: hypothetical protein E2O76_14675 [Caldithrix sp.]
MRFPVFKLLILAAVTITFNSHASPSGSRGKALLYSINVHTGQAPVLDGRLSKDEWKDAAYVYNFTQKEPLEGSAISEPTIVLIKYDKDNIYFGIRCFDKEAQKIVANEMRRDYDLSENDYFEIIIDTFHDQRNAYYFATNSLGARLDGEVKSEGAHINWEWDGIWKSSARKDKYGWTAEIAIPFKTLRFDNSDELTWGINFGRYIPRKREEAYWAPISRDDDFDSIGKFKPSKFGTLNGLRNIKQQQRFQIKPYAIGGVERDFEFGTSIDKLGEVGLDTKVHLTSNLVADLTVNTDFAQVEADVEQVNLSRFSLFFPEKRDFFIEGLDIFNIGAQSFGEPLSLLFFSRNIGLDAPIIGGVKMTGKEGPYEIGLLNVYTNSNNSGIPKTNYAALRVKRDVLQRSYIGFMGLSRDSKREGDYNRTFAVDGSFSFDNNINVNGYFAKTQTPGLKGKDTNSFVDFSWGTDMFYTNASFTDIGQNFNPEMGFLQWQDIRRYTLKLTSSPRPKLFNTRQTYLSYELDYITDHNNQLQYRIIEPTIYNMFNDESYIFVGLSNYYDLVPVPLDSTDSFQLGPTVIPPGIYKYNIFGVSYGSDLSRKISGIIQGGAGSFYNGEYQSVGLYTYLRPDDRFAIDLNWEWNRVDVPFPNGKFTTSILGARINYSFTTDLFAKAYIQWNDVEKKIISNFLVRYRYKPGSDFYFVYNEESNTGGKFRTANRTLIAKFTYLLNI